MAQPPNRKPKITNAFSVLLWSVLTAVTVKIFSNLTRSEEGWIGAAVCLLFAVMLVALRPSISTPPPNPSPSVTTSSSHPDQTSGEGLLQAIVDEHPARIICIVLSAIVAATLIVLGILWLGNSPTGSFIVKSGTLSKTPDNTLTTYPFSIHNVPQNDLVWVALGVPNQRIGPSGETFTYYYTSVNQVPGMTDRWAASFPINNDDVHDKTFFVSLYTCLASDTEILAGDSRSGANNALDATRECTKLDSICVTKQGNRPSRAAWSVP